VLLRRFATFALVLGGMLLTGCTSYLTETNPEEPWSRTRFNELRHEDRQRLAGEDRSKSTASEYLTYIPRKIWQGMEWTWNYSTDHRPSKYAKQLFDQNPDIRRDAIYALSDYRFGRQEPYTKYYAHMAGDDADPTVRAAALRALNRSRAAQFIDTYVAGLSDSSPWVRLEAAKALANIPSDKAVPGLTKLLADENQTRDIRVACADALRAYHQSDVAQALIRVVGDRDFGVAWQARRSLNLMTGKDYRYDATAWLEYLTRTEKPFAASLPPNSPAMDG